MKHLKRIVLAAFAVALIGSGVLPATTASAVSSGSSASLSIPPKKNYIIEPGKTVDDKLTLRNLDTTADLNLTLRVVDFSFTDDGGTPKLMLDPAAPQTTWSLKPFLEVPETVTIPAGESKTLDMNVSIPAGHGAGSYYSAIIYSTGATEGGNVGLSASGVTLVFTTIPGKVNEDLQLEKFGAYRRATPGQEASYLFITTQEPDTIAYTLKNNGNVTESPVGSIKLKNMFGKEYTIDNVNPTGSLALIGQSRTFMSCIKLQSQNIDFNGTTTEANTCTNPGLWPGYYSVSVDLFYGQNGNNTQEIVKTGGFWYLPWWFLVAVAVVLAVVAFYVWKIVRTVRLMKNGGHRKSTRK